MKNYILVLILWGIWGVGLMAQSQYFSRTHDLNGFREMSYAMIKTSDGYIITGGQSGSQSMIELFVAKVSWYGDTIWTKVLKHPFRHFTAGQINCIAPRQQGGFYIYGSTNDTIGSDADAFLYCFDVNGDSIFTKVFGGSEYDVGSSIIESSCGHIYALGETASKGDPRKDIYLIKLDSLGNVLWEKTYGTLNVIDQAHTISMDGDHTLYLGTSYINGFAQGFNNNIPRLIKLDSSGAQKYSRTVITTDTDLPAGSFGFAHVHRPNEIYLFSGPMNNGYVGKIYVTLFDSLGAKIFTKSIVGPRVFVASADFFSNPDGSLMVCGIGNTVPSYTYNGWDKEDDGGLILKLSPNADSVWARYHIVQPGQYQSLFYAIEPSPFGGYFLAGTYVNGPVQDIWLMSVDANGCVGTDSCGVEQPIVTIRDADVLIGDSPLLVYPNPASHLLHIQIPEVYSGTNPSISGYKKSRHLYNPMHSRPANPFLEPEQDMLMPLVQQTQDIPSSATDCRVYLYATDGRLVRSMNQSWAKEMDLSLTGIPDGLYFLRVEYGGLVYGERVLVMDN